MSRNVYTRLTDDDAQQLGLPPIRESDGYYRDNRSDQHGRIIRQGPSGFKVVLDPTAPCDAPKPKPTARECLVAAKAHMDAKDYAGCREALDKALDQLGEVGK